MNYRKVTAIANAKRLEAVEEALRSCSVPRITVTQVHSRSNAAARGMQKRRNP